MRAFKLLKLRRDGTVGPLFINAAARLPVGVWMPAEAHRRKGFAFRPGWHVMAKPEAPHLKERLASGERREWWLVEIDDYIEERRPDAQGGVWYLAQRMKLIAPLDREAQSLKPPGWYLADTAAPSSYGFRRAARELGNLGGV